MYVYQHNIIYSSKLGLINPCQYSITYIYNIFNVLYVCHLNVVEILQYNILLVCYLSVLYVF